MTWKKKSNRTRSGATNPQGLATNDTRPYIHERGQANKTQVKTNKGNHKKLEKSKDRKSETKYDTQGKVFTIKQEISELKAQKLWQYLVVNQIICWGIWMKHISYESIQLQKNVTQNPQKTELIFLIQTFSLDSLSETTCSWHRKQLHLYII